MSFLSRAWHHDSQRFGLAAVVVWSLLQSLSMMARADEVVFNRDIRPLLSEYCFTCHGPDAQQRQAGLRLDIRSSALGPAESGKAAIVSGQPASSELIARITSDNAELQMPPPETGKQLTPAQRNLLREWIQQGADYAGHWSFSPVTRPAIPESMDFAGIAPSNHPIDRFVRARLARESLAPTPPADKVTQLRRVTLDLTGLPPTPAEVDAFLADDTPAAYERAVDRLLASPRYGERMAITWLDYARYADSNGFQSDGSRDIWAWREWVVNAFNRNLPFDQFTIEQLAGDMLPGATPDQIIATGFNRNHRLNGEGGRIEAEWFVETVIDRVETTGLTWLGLTFNCCRCHDHKYDPISQKEFYSMFAFFNSGEESGVLAPVGKNGENTPPLLAIPSEQQKAELAKLEAAVVAAKARMAEVQQQAPQLLAAWERQVQEGQLSATNPWLPLEIESVESKGGATLKALPDGSYLAGGPNPANDQYLIRALLPAEQFSGLLVEVFPDESLPNQSLGRGSNGNFVLTDVSVRLFRPGVKKPTMVKFSRALADYEQTSYTAANILSNPPVARQKTNRRGWAIDGNAADKRLPRKLLLAADEILAAAAGSTIEITLGHNSQFSDHNVGRFRLSVAVTSPAQLQLSGDGLPADVKTNLAIPSAERSAAQVERLLQHLQSVVPGPLADAKQGVIQAEKKVSDYRETLPTTMVMREGKPRDAFVLLRGQYDKPGEKVARALPAVLPPLPTGASVDRLGLARWIVDPSNPLTARVWVNREWERFFGLGLVRTTENLGSQAEYPSHPELLDWLASEFMQPTTIAGLSGSTGQLPPQAWDMKALQKLIVMSATYRQASRTSDETRARDPENRWLARGPRFRLSGELIRDSALFVSGLLVEKLGGPSVRPYMPAGVWDETSKYGNLRNYQMEKGPGQYRRTLYTIWKRTAAPPTMLLFDAPNREICTIKRSRTNTPLQALSLLNEVTFVEAAKNLAARMLREGGDSDSARVTYGFRLAVGRRPTTEELAVLVQGLEADRASLATDREATEKLVGAPSDAPATADSLAPLEQASYTLTANILLNLDEFVTRE